MAKARVPFAVRFWAKVARAADDQCWRWMGAMRKDGYGMIQAPSGPGMTVAAHRASWALTHGPIPDGLGVLHRCDNPPCVNPAHLFLGTNRDNVEDRQAKGRGGAKPRQVVCLRGHVVADVGMYVRRNDRGYVQRQCRACVKENSARARRAGA